MKRELDGIELGQRAAVPLLLENQRPEILALSWVTYLAQVAGWGGSR